MTQATILIGDYTPGFLLDALRQKMGFRSDKALARALEIYPSTLAKVRNAKAHLPSSLLFRIHEMTGIGVRDLRSLMGDRRAKDRTGKEVTSRCGTLTSPSEPAAPASAMPLNNSRHTLH
jgi:hypothetical protein